LNPFTAVFSSKRVKFYTFNQEDTEVIWEVYGERTAENATNGLVVYCGVYDGELTHDQPFKYRMVLWINQQYDGNQPRFYEFANPCPPFCKEEDIS
ncbi:MAG: hypothetical protein AAFP19_22365, partial [Bacteroidota bacterium]